MSVIAWLNYHGYSYGKFYCGRIDGSKGGVDDRRVNEKTKTVDRFEDQVA